MSTCCHEPNAPSRKAHKEQLPLPTAAAAGAHLRKQLLEVLVQQLGPHAAGQQDRRIRGSMDQACMEGDGIGARVWLP